MNGRTIGSALALAGLAAFAPLANGFDDVPNTPPSVTMGVGTWNGKTALYATVTDADGASDLKGIGFDFLMDDGTTYRNPLAIMLYFTFRKGIAWETVGDGKRVWFTKLPGNCASLKAVGTDSELAIGSAVHAVPAEVRAGNPKFGVKR
jgi:hypothetical protein